MVEYFGSDPNESWKAIAVHEERLQSILLEYLNAREDVVVYGERSSDASLRVPVISFSIKGMSSRKFVEKVEACSDFGIRWGFFYSKKLVDELLELRIDGVIRVSMVHYNTGKFHHSYNRCMIDYKSTLHSQCLQSTAEEEVRGLVDVFKKILL